MALLVSDILRLTHLKNMHVEAGAGGLNRYVVTAASLIMNTLTALKPLLSRSTNQALLFPVFSSPRMSLL